MLTNSVGHDVTMVEMKSGGRGMSDEGVEWRECTALPISGEE